MKSWKKPTNELIDKALQSTKKVTARKYFFSRLENPLWLKPLAERDCFKYPPKPNDLMMAPFNTLTGPRFNISKTCVGMPPMKLSIW